MAKSRRKSNGCKRGTYKPKKMGKGALKDSRPARGKRPEHTTPEAMAKAAEKRAALAAEQAAKSSASS